MKTRTRARATSPSAAKGRASRAAKPAPSLVDTILAILDDAKAEDPVTIDLAGKSPMADHMVIATGRSDRHVGAIADQLQSKLKALGVTGIRVEGLPHCDWVLVDAGDIIVHVFRPDVRSFYNLEKMWSPAAPDERDELAG